MCVSNAPFFSAPESLESQAGSIRDAASPGLVSCWSFALLCYRLNQYLPTSWEQLPTTILHNLTGLVVFTLKVGHSVFASVLKSLG